MSNIKRNQLPSDDTLSQMYSRMLLIRKSEEQLFQNVKLGRTPGQVICLTGRRLSLSERMDDRDRLLDPSWARSLSSQRR